MESNANLLENVFLHIHTYKKKEYLSNTHSKKVFDRKVEQEEKKERKWKRKKGKFMVENHLPIRLMNFKLDSLSF